MGLSKKQRQNNIGRFVQDSKGNIVFVDDREHVWSQENIMEIIRSCRSFRYFVSTMDYYKSLFK